MFLTLESDPVATWLVFISVQFRSHFVAILKKVWTHRRTRAVLLRGPSPQVFIRMANGEQPRPVAVVAVHGVGYCPPFSIARHISSMLLGLGRLRVRSGVPWPTGGDVDQPYGACVEESIQIPLQPALVSNPRAAQARLVSEPDRNATGRPRWPAGRLG